MCVQPNIVPLRHYFYTTETSSKAEEETYLCLVLEYVPGEEGG